MSLMLPGVAVTYNGEEIGMTNTDVSWEDTVDPAGLNCGEEHFMVRGIFCQSTLIKIRRLFSTTPESSVHCASKVPIFLSESSSTDMSI